MNSQNKDAINRNIASLNSDKLVSNFKKTHKSLSNPKSRFTAKKAETGEIYYPEKYRINSSLSKYTKKSNIFRNNNSSELSKNNSSNFILENSELEQLSINSDLSHSSKLPNDNFNHYASKSQQRLMNHLDIVNNQNLSLRDHLYNIFTDEKNSKLINYIKYIPNFEFHKVSPDLFGNLTVENLISMGLCVGDSIRLYKLLNNL